MLLAVLLAAKNITSSPPAINIIVLVFSNML